MDRNAVIEKARELHKAGNTYPQIAKTLRSAGALNAKGQPYSTSSLYQMVHSRKKKMSPPRVATTKKSRKDDTVDCLKAILANEAWSPTKRIAVAIQVLQ